MGRESHFKGPTPDEIERKLKAKFGRKVELAVTKMVEATAARTPVHSGKTVRNWVASENVPIFTDLPALGSGPIGETSKMALGTEPRRRANEDEALASLRRLDFSEPYKKYFLANGSRVDDADPVYQSQFAGQSRAELVEYGTLPSITAPRNQPAGSLRYGVEMAKFWLKSVRGAR